MYDSVNTDFDVMKEFLIQGATLVGKYGFPALRPVFVTPEDTVDFSESFSRSLKGRHRDLNVNFYIRDCQFQRFWNNPDKYIKGHLNCFGSVTGPDFTIALGDGGMPLAMNLWQKYRNHALSFYMDAQGCKVIPSVSIGDRESWEWIFDGIPEDSTLAVCTNGRIKSKAARLEFCDGFYEMCRRLKPLNVIIYGHMPPELEPPVEIVNLQTRNQKMNQGGEKAEMPCDAF